jgi:hypothetical protein
MAHDHNSIYTIVERLRIIEEGLTTNQKSVNQLSATFKPKTVAVLTAKTDPKNPMAGKLVGGNESIEDDEEPLEEAVTSEDTLSKVKASFADYLKTVTDEIRQDSDLKDKKHEDSDIKEKSTVDRALVAKQQKIKEVDSEIGAALSGEIPAQQPAGEEGVSMKETAVDEEYNMDQLRKDAAASVSKSLDNLNKPRPQKSFMAQVGDKQMGMVKGALKGLTGGTSAVKESAAVKVITNECGMFEVHGNEKTGFEIRHGNRRLPTRFKNLDEAEMALEMFAARRRKINDSADYIDEA